MINQQQQNNFQDKQNQQSIFQDEKVEHGGSCSHCGHSTLPGADICEHCGSWQLIGQCCFCYAPVGEGQKFCGTCGNEPQGKACPNCGTHSIFDFCPKCEHPISKGAPDYLDQIKNTPQVVEILQQINELDVQLSKGKTTTNNSEPEWLAQLTNYQNQFNTSQQPVKQTEVKPGFRFNKANKDVSEDLNAVSQYTHGSNTSADIEQKRDELRKKIADLQNRAFSSNQEARRFYTSVAIAVPQIMSVKYIDATSRVWLCNYAGVTHNNPSDCGCPSMGGTWIGGNPAKTVVDIVYTNI